MHLYSFTKEAGGAVRKMSRWLRHFSLKSNQRMKRINHPRICLSGSADLMRGLQAVGRHGKCKGREMNYWADERSWDVTEGREQD